MYFYDFNGKVWINWENMHFNESSRSHGDQTLLVLITLLALTLCTIIEVSDIKTHFTVSSKLLISLFLPCCITKLSNICNYIGINLGLPSDLIMTPALSQDGLVTFLRDSTGCTHAFSLWCTHAFSLLTSFSFTVLSTVLLQIRMQCCVLGTMSQNVERGVSPTVGSVF